MGLGFRAALVAGVAPRVVTASPARADCDGEALRDDYGAVVNYYFYGALHRQGAVRVDGDVACAFRTFRHG